MGSSKMELEAANSHQLWTNMLGQPVFSCSLNTTSSSFFPYLHFVSPSVSLFDTYSLAKSTTFDSKGEQQCLLSVCVCVRVWLHWCCREGLVSWLLINFKCSDLLTEMLITCSSLTLIMVFSTVWESEAVRFKRDWWVHSQSLYQGSMLMCRPRSLQMHCT